MNRLKYKPRIVYVHFVFSTQYTIKPLSAANSFCNRMFEDVAIHRMNTGSECFSIPTQQRNYSVDRKLYPDMSSNVLCRGEVVRVAPIGLPGYFLRHNEDHFDLNTCAERGCCPLNETPDSLIFCNLPGFHSAVPLSR